MTSANRGGAVNRQGCGIWFTDCEGVGSKGARRGFLLGGPRRFLAALKVQVYAQCDNLATDLRRQRFASTVSYFQLLHLHLTYPPAFCAFVGGGDRVWILRRFSTPENSQGYRMALFAWAYERVDWLLSMKTKNFTEGHVPACIERFKLGISELTCSYTIQKYWQWITFH